MGGPGSQQTHSPLAPVRISPPIQPGGDKEQVFPQTISECASKSKNKLSRQSKARSINCNDRSVVRKEVYSGNGRNRVRFLLPSVLGPQEIRGVETSDRLVNAKQIALSSDVRNGHLSKSQESVKGRNVGNIVGSVRRLSPHTHSGTIQSIPLLPSRKQTLHAPGTTIRTDDGPMGIHGSCKRVEEMGSGQRHDSIPVLRRLVKRSHVSRRAFAKYTGSSRAMPTPGPIDQYKKVRTNSHAIHRFSGRETRSSIRSRIPIRRQDFDHHTAYQISHQPSWPELQKSGIPTGSTVGNCTHDPTRKATHTLFSVGSDPSSTTRKEPCSMDPSDRPSSRQASVVANSSRADNRSTVPNSETPSVAIYGRLDEGVGSSVPGSILGRIVEKINAHQLARVTGSTDSVTNPTIPTQGQGSSLLDRQLHGSVIHKETRRHQVALPSQAVNTRSRSRIPTRDHTHPTTHSGQEQCVSGLGLQERPSDTLGMDSVLPSVQLGVKDLPLGPTTNRLVRKQHESPSIKVRIPLPGREGMGGGCANLPVVHAGAVRVPSINTDISIPRASVTGERVQSAASSTTVFTREVVTSTQQPGSSEGDTFPPIPGFVTTAPLGLPTPEPGISTPTPVVPRRDILRKEGFSNSVIKRLEKARAQSTVHHYASQWKLFEAWCNEHKLNPLNASLPLLTEFLEYLFKERKVSVRTIKNYKSALAFQWKTLVGYVMPEKDYVVTDLFRGFKRERPIPKKVVVDWDVRLVLNYFQSGRYKTWNSLTDKELTLKTIFLLALATGKRRGELHALSCNVQWIKGDTVAVRLSPVPDFISKTHIATSGLSAFQSVDVQALDKVVGSADVEERLLCPVRTLRYYMSRADTYRSKDQKKLFISHMRGKNKDVSKQAISSYIKEAICLAYKDLDPKSEIYKTLGIKAHSVRHIATSLNALRNFSMCDLLKAGTWRSPNVFLSHYMQNFTTDELSKLSRMGGFVSAGTII